jgi:hypothetical protein
MEEPKNLDPEAWARWNEYCAQTVARMLGWPMPTIEREQMRIEVQSCGPLNDLLWSVRNAASELEGTSEKADRIATQLLTALAKFARETDMP